MLDHRSAIVAFTLLLFGVASAHGGADHWGDPCRAGDAARSERILAVYEARDMAAIWVDRNGPTQAGARLVEQLEAVAAGERGVLTECLQRALDGDRRDVSPGQLDVMLTDAYLALARRRAGADAGDGVLLAPLQQASDDRQLVAAVERATDRPTRTGHGASASAPTSADLDTALARYRAIRAAGGWPAVASGPDIEPGMRDVRVPAVRERLARTGDLAAAAADPRTNRYTATLAAAVRAFQARHGLDATAVVDAATRAAMNVPVEQRIRQLRVNRARLREHAAAGEHTLVRVNIPDFRVELHRRGEIVYTTRAIVGRPAHPTPVLDDRLTRLMLNPAWHVPARIAREELAPRFARQPGYAERHGYELTTPDRPVSSIDWSDPPALRLRQRPGPTNALGRIKFVLANDRAIYLHDTPARHLFQARQRAHSAGCVRVEQPLELAARLVGGDRGQLAREIRGGETRAVRFGHRVPVQLVYFTAWTDDNGQVQFREDIYGRDDRAIAALADAGD